MNYNLFPNRCLLHFVCKRVVQPFVEALSFGGTPIHWFYFMNQRPLQETLIGV